jgi:sugar phosphate permease
LDLNASKAVEAVKEAKSGERANAKRIPWGAIMTTPQFWGVIFALFSANWINYVFMSWLPTYMTRQLGMSLQDSGLYSFLPVLVKAALAPVVGAIAQAMQKRGVRVLSTCFFISFPLYDIISLIFFEVIRRLFACVTLFVPAVLLVVLSFVPVPIGGAVAILVPSNVIISPHFITYYLFRSSRLES